MTTAQRTYTTFHVLGERPRSIPDKLDLLGEPVEIPEGWLIFNAPRPLHATRLHDTDIYPEWQGKFYHGIFYTAVDPEDPHSIERNISLDGWVLKFVTTAEAMAWAEEYYLKEYGIKADVTLSYGPEDLTRAYLNVMTKDVR